MNISNWKTGVIPLVIFLMVVGVQRELVNPTAEKIEEDRFSDFSDLPVSSAVPAYIGSLFLGAFRAIAVDFLWMEYTEAKSKQLYHEQKQLVELLTRLQPRNEEAWAYLGWDLSYNLAKTAPTPDEEWRYIREGIERLMDGSRINANSVQILFDIAHTLTFKATWMEGEFQEDYLRHYARDVEFQRLLLGKESETRLPFEASRHWYVKAREKIRERSQASKLDAEQLAHVVTVSGIGMRESGMDLFINETDYYEAMYYWRHGDFDAAAVSLDRAIGGAGEMLLLYGRRLDSPENLRKKLALYTALRDLLPIAKEKLKTGSRGDLIDLLTIAEPLQARFAGADYSHLFAWLSKTKQAAGGDSHEMNDEPYIARLFKRGHPFERCTIGPTAGDIDMYVIRIGEGVDDPARFRPERIRVDLRGGKGLPLRIIVTPYFEAFRQEFTPLIARTTTGETEIETLEFVAQSIGDYLMTVTAADPNRWSPDIRYSLELVEGQR